MTTSHSDPENYPRLINGPYDGWKCPPTKSGLYGKKIELYPDCDCHADEKFVYLKKLDASQSEPVVYYLYAGSITTEEAGDGRGMDSCGFELEPEN